MRGRAAPRRCRGHAIRRGSGARAGQTRDRGGGERPKREQRDGEGHAWLVRPVSAKSADSNSSCDRSVASRTWTTPTTCASSSGNCDRRSRRTCPWRIRLRPCDQLTECDLRLRSCHSMFDRNASAFQTRPIARPAFGKEEARSHRHGHLAACKCQGHQRLAIRGFAQCRSVLRSDADRVLAFLRHGRVINHQYRIAVSAWTRSSVSSGAASQILAATKMMQLIIATGRKSLRHGRNALAITRADQPSYVKRTHPPPCFMPQTLNEWLEPAPKVAFPTDVRIRHGRPLHKADHP